MKIDLKHPDFKIKRHSFYQLIERVVQIFRGKKIVISLAILNYYTRTYCSIDTFMIILSLSIMLILVKEWIDRLFREFKLLIHGIKK